MSADKERDNRDKNLLERFSSAAQTAPAEESLRPPERICFNHAELEGLYYCFTCRVWRCKECAHVYNGVAVCPDCDTISTHASKIDEQPLVAEPLKPFSYELKRAFSFP